MLHKAAVIILILLLSGCSMQYSPLPSGGPNSATGSDREAGGGIVSTEEVLVGSGRAVPGADPTATQAPTAAPLPGVEMPRVSPGGSFQQGGLTFRLGRVLVELDSTVLEVEVQGLAQEYAPAQQTGAPLLVLPNGAQLQASGADGTGSPGVEKTTYTFPALPIGTKSFQLLIENQWNGTLETWRVPVVLLE